MLVLTRKLDESIIINDDIRITVLNIRGNQVRIGVEAPQSVMVLREELYDRVCVGEECKRSSSACAANESATS